MRPRSEIEDSYKSLTVPAGQSDTYRLLFDLLLDIREILDSMRERTFFEMVSEAREEVDRKRREEVARRLT